VAFAKEAEEIKVDTQRASTYWVGWRKHSRCRAGLRGETGGNLSVADS
jgi:hypothetical protein